MKKNMHYEDIVTGELEFLPLREVRLFSEKVHLVPEWLTQELSSNPYFGMC